jgi:hypothetical protein
MTEVNKYWEAVQANVCAHCIDSDGTGACRLAGDIECGLKRYFPDVVDIVLSVQSDSLGPYVTALREKVCAICEHQSKKGACLVRTEIDCGLDRYYPKVIESIESYRIERDRDLTEYLRVQ